MAHHIQGDRMSTDPRNVVITGANRGIGRAIAERFVAAGDNVATIYRGGDLPEGVFGAVADMRDSAAVDAAFTAIEEHQGPHLSYAFQWWVFAAGALVGLVVLARREIGRAHV